MDGYTPRRAPNVSQYVADLNTIPSDHDVAIQQQDGFTFGDDLALFTNTQFFDFDIGEQVDAAPKYDATDEERARRANASARKINNGGLEYVDGTCCSLYDPRRVQRGRKLDEFWCVQDTRNCWPGPTLGLRGLLHNHPQLQTSRPQFRERVSFGIDGCCDRHEASIGLAEDNLLSLSSRPTE
jgi:hypothetical protein